MSKDLKPFGQGFQNENYLAKIGADVHTDELDIDLGDEGEDSGSTKRAEASWKTNSLRIFKSRDRQLEMAIAAAFVSREEFLHGEWRVGVLNSLSRIVLAANDALAQGVRGSQVGSESDREDTTGTTGDTDLSEYLLIVAACRQAVNMVYLPMSPFVEAVDKFQLLTVTDEGLVDDVVSTFEQNSASQSDTGDEQLDREQFNQYVYAILDTETKIALGEATVDDGNRPYIRPEYFHALADIVDTWQETGVDAIGEPAVSRSQALAVAEAAARATLDVPEPIMPLNDDGFPSFAPLTIPGIDKSVKPSKLHRRYPMTENEFETYLGRYPDVESSRSASGTGVSEADTDSEGNGAAIEETITGSDWSYSEAKNDWVARSFVNVRKELREIREDSGVEIAEDPERLRQVLVERVHGDEPKSRDADQDTDDSEDAVENAQTMVKHPTALLDIPRSEDTDSLDEDVLSEPGTPLAKIILEAFEHHGSFGGVIYNDGRKPDYILNYNVRGEPVDRDTYHHLPPVVTSPNGDKGPNETVRYEDCWRHYYFWDGMRKHLFEALEAYESALIEELVAEFDDPDELEEALEDTRDQLKGQMGAQGTAPSDVSDHPDPPAQAGGNISRHQMAQRQRSEGWEAASERFISTVESADDDGAAERRAVITDSEGKGPWTTKVLALLAAARDIDTDIEAALSESKDTNGNPLDTVECPLCNIHTGYCGPDVECGNVEIRNQFEDMLPELVEGLVDAQAENKFKSQSE
jgi:hypothetical protein